MKLLVKKIKSCRKCPMRFKDTKEKSEEDNLNIFVIGRYREPKVYCLEKNKEITDTDMRKIDRFPGWCPLVDTSAVNIKITERTYK